MWWVLRRRRRKRMWSRWRRRSRRQCRRRKRGKGEKEKQEKWIADKSVDAEGRGQKREWWVLDSWHSCAWTEAGVGLTSAASLRTRGTSGTSSTWWPRAMSSAGTAEAASAEHTAYRFCFRFTRRCHRRHVWRIRGGERHM
jgi:hypothetical protein